MYFREQREREKKEKYFISAKIRTIRVNPRSIYFIPTISKS